MVAIQSDLDESGLVGRQRREASRLPPVLDRVPDERVRHVPEMHDAVRRRHPERAQDQRIDGCHHRARHAEDDPEGEGDDGRTAMAKDEPGLEAHGGW